MADLFDILLGVARDSGMLREGTATGGGTTTIVDNVGRDEDADVFNGGTAFIVYDAGGAAAAPEGQSKLVTDFASGGTITTQAFSAAVVSGDYYGVMNKRYPRWAMIQAVNESLRDIGRVGTVDSTTLDTAASTREYNLPVVAKYDLRQVWLAQTTAAPFRWRRLRTWRTEWTSGGAVGKLIFDEQLPAGYGIKLIYMAEHPAVRDDTGQISDYVPRQRLIAEAVMRLYRWRLIKVGSSNATAIQLFNEASAKLERIKRLYPIHEPEKLPQLWMENKPYTTIETNV